MSVENKKTWKCQACYCNFPKSNNTDTPIRPRDREILEMSPPDNTNVTIRNKTINNLNMNTSTDETSLLGDTVNSENTLMLQNLSEIIHQRLRENNTSIILELKNTIQQEIHSAITKFKEDLQQKTTKLFEENDIRRKEIECINTKIQEMTEENEKLKKEMKRIESRISAENNTENQKNYVESHSSNEIKNKKIVLYGLPEHRNEPECVIYNRLTDLFYNITEIDVTGYIENAYRIGRNYNKNRPLVVEFISKRLTRLLLENKNYFKGTGVFISEFMDVNEQKENKKLKEEMFEARKKGYHAVIINKQLYIDGKNVTKEKKIVTPKDSKIAEVNNNNKEPKNTEGRRQRIEEHDNQLFRSHRSTI